MPKCVKTLTSNWHQKEENFFKHYLRSLKCIQFEEKNFLTKFPCGAPMGSGLDQNCTCTTRTRGQQHETINRSLRYLVREEIEEQDIVYGRTDRQTDELMDGRTTDERVSHKLDCSLTSRANKSNANVVKYARRVNLRGK